MITTNEPYPWSFVTKISVMINQIKVATVKAFEVMTST